MSLQNTTESEDDGIGKSTSVQEDTAGYPVRCRAFSDTNVPNDTDGSHIAKAGYVCFMPT